MVFVERLELGPRASPGNREKKRLVAGNCASSSDDIGGLEREGMCQSRELVVDWNRYRFERVCGRVA